MMMCVSTGVHVPWVQVWSSADNLGVDSLFPLWVPESRLSMTRFAHYVLFSKSTGLPHNACTSFAAVATFIIVTDVTIDFVASKVFIHHLNICLN